MGRTQGARDGRACGVRLLGLNKRVLGSGCPHRLRLSPLKGLAAVRADDGAAAPVEAGPFRRAGDTR